MCDILFYRMEGIRYMKKPILVVLIVLLVVSVCLGGFGFYYSNKDKEAEASKKIVECTFDGELVDGAEYVNGQYTYTFIENVYAYISDSIDYNDKLAQKKMNADLSNVERGWSVELTDKENTNPVTSRLCGTVNNLPIISTRRMFSYAATEQIDLSGFDTSKVIDMSEMFDGLKISNLDLSSFDTSNVIDTSYMFGEANINSLNLAGLDMNKVIDMSSMFRDANINNLNLTNLKTNNAETMRAMFLNATIKSISGLESLNTSNVKNMEAVFAYFNTETIDLSGFDTSNVEDMNTMFAYSSASEIKGLNNFNTSNVKDMRGMFEYSNVNELDLSSFDLSNIKTIVCDEDEEVKTDNTYVNYYCLTSEYGDILYGEYDVFGTNSMFDGAVATTGYARTKEDASILNKSENIPSTLKFVVK